MAVGSDEVWNSMSKRRNIHPAERRRYFAVLTIAAAALVGLGAEIAYMVTAAPL